MYIQQILNKYSIFLKKKTIVNLRHSKMKERNTKWLTNKRRNGGKEELNDFALNFDAK